MVDVIFLDSSKTFDTILQSTLLDILSNCEMKRFMLCWVTNWLNGRVQSFLLNGDTYKWQLVISGVSQGSILGPILFFIFINDLYAGVECIHSKFADDTKLEDAVDSLQGWEALQRNLDRLEHQSIINDIKLNKGKWWILQVGCSNARHKYRLGDEWLENKQFSEKGSGGAIWQ